LDDHGTFDVQAGNCVVLKPSEVSANSTKLLAKLIPQQVPMFKLLLHQHFVISTLLSESALGHHYLALLVCHGVSALASLSCPRVCAVDLVGFSVVQNTGF
jgi:hypothetical protein